MDIAVSELQLCVDGFRDVLNGSVRPFSMSTSFPGVILTKS